jgi:glycosyltransferase involved in cell wall biosynthesis
MRNRLRRFVARLRSSYRVQILTKTLLPQVWTLFRTPIRYLIGLPRLVLARVFIARENWGAVLWLLAPHVRPDKPILLKSAKALISVNGKVGDFEAAYLLADRLARQIKRRPHVDRADGVRGRLLEVHPAWIPSVNLSRPEPTPEPHPRRVLYLAKESAPYLHNGFCTRSHETLRAVRATGTEVMAVTMPGFPASIGIKDAPESVIVDEVTYHHLSPNSAMIVNQPANQYLDLAATALAKFVLQHQPTILHIGSGHRGFETALVGRAVAEWFGIPWVYEVRSFFETTWTSDPRYMESAPYFHLRHATESRCMEAADYVVTLSGPMKDEITSTHGIPQEKVIGIPNAVDLERFASQKRDEDLRQQLGLDGAYVLGYVSNLSHPREGVEAMIKALPVLRARGVNAKVLLVGEGKRMEMLKKMAAKLGIASHVIFTGSIAFDKVAAYYAQIDLFVVPRTNERAGRLVSPMKPFEAMAMRIPLLVSDLPALVEIVDDPTDPRGLTYRAEDHKDLARAAYECATNPERVASWIDNAAAWVARERTWSANGGAFVRAYEEAEKNFAKRVKR